MDTSYVNPQEIPRSYERLIYDILRGDSTLFSRWDEVEAADHHDKLIRYRNRNVKFPNYDAGSMGPIRAFELLARMAGSGGIYKERVRYDYRYKFKKFIYLNALTFYAGI